jgi:hypothetical protein
MNEKLNHNHFMINWRMESTFVITYLMVHISVNSVTYRQQTEELNLFSPVGRGLFVYKECCVVRWKV